MVKIHNKIITNYYAYVSEFIYTLKLIHVYYTEYDEEK